MSSQLLQRGVVKHQFVGNLDQHLVAQEQRNNFLRPSFVDLQTGQHVVERRNLEARRGECLLDCLFRFGFFIFQDHAATREADEVAGDFQFFLTSEEVKHRRQYLGRCCDSLAQVLLADASNQGIFFMEGRNAADN